MEIPQVLATLLVILMNGIAAIITARFIKLPLTLCLLVWGVISAAIIPESGFDTGIRADNFQTLVMYVLIPVLVFEAALSINVKILRPILATILFASTAGIIVAIIISATLLYYVIGHSEGFPWIAALLAGLVISATDPAAVVVQLKKVEAPESLSTLIEGESLFNDATAIVLFGILLAMALGHSQVSLGSGTYQLIFVLVGGLATGLLSALLSIAIIYVLPKNNIYYVILSLTLAYGSFYTAEHLLHVSGVIAVLCSALVIKPFLMKHKECNDHIHNIWEFLGFMANIVVFYLMGLVVTFDMFSERWLAMLIGIAAAFLSRLVSCYISLACGKWIFRNPLEWQYGPVMIWGGLRGAVTLALVLSLPVELEYWWTIQSIGFGVVLFTLLVQATTMTPLLRKLTHL